MEQQERLDYENSYEQLGNILPALMSGVGHDTSASSIGDTPLMVTVSSIPASDSDRDEEEHDLVNDDDGYNFQ